MADATEREGRSELEQKLALRGEVRRLRSERDRLVKAARPVVEGAEPDDDGVRTPPSRESVDALRDVLEDVEGGEVEDVAQWETMECGACGAAAGTPCLPECDADCGCPTCAAPQDASTESTKVEDLHPVCRETHEEIVAWLKAEGVHMTLDRKQALYQWLEKYAAARRLRRGGGEPLTEWVGSIGVCAKCTLPSERGGDPMRICGKHADLLAEICGRPRDDRSEERDGMMKWMVCESCGEDFQSSDADGWPTVCPDCRPEERPGGSGERHERPAGEDPFWVSTLARCIDKLEYNVGLIQEVEPSIKHRLESVVGNLEHVLRRLRRPTPEGEGDDVLDAVAEELASARDGFMDFPSAHHGYAVLLEEVDELWEEVQRFPRAPYDDNPAANAALRGEAIQVAAMAVRFIEDVTDHPAQDEEDHGE